MCSFREKREGTSGQGNIQAYRPNKDLRETAFYKLL